MPQKSYSFILKIVSTGNIRSHLALSILATAIHILLLIAQPIIITKLIKESTTQVESNTQLTMLVLASAMGISALAAYFAAKLNNSIMQDFRRETKYILYSSILKKRLPFFSHHNEGSMESAISTASLAARTIIHDCLGTVIRAAFFVISSAALIFSRQPFYGLIFLIAASVYFCTAYACARRSAPAVVSAVSATTNVSKEVSDMFANLDSIQGNDMVENEGRRLLSILNIEREIYMKGQGIMNENEFSQKIFLISIFMGFILSVSFNEEGNAASTIMLYIIGLLAYSQLELIGRTLSSIFEQSFKLEAALEKISFHENVQASNKNLIETHEDIKNISISLNDVSFYYSPESPLCANISKQIKPGTHHIISGESGIGKSTLLKIMSGQLKPTYGQALLGKADLFSLSLEEKARYMTIIHQNVNLFNRSIYENATYGIDNIDHSYLEELLLSLKLDRVQRAGAKHWLDLKVDQNSLNLSGGEKQRILLARAILRARPLLFLDESTSALDRETETAVLRVLHERLPHTTIVAVCHHPHAELAGYQTLALT